MKFSLDQNVLTIELSGWERFISATMSSQIKVPLNQIASIDTDGSKILKKWFLGFRVGTQIPGFFAAGHFHHMKTQPDFLYFHWSQLTADDEVISLTLKDHAHYRKIIVAVPKDQGSAKEWKAKLGFQ